MINCFFALRISLKSASECTKIIIIIKKIIEFLNCFGVFEGLFWCEVVFKINEITCFWGILAKGTRFYSFEGVFLAIFWENWIILLFWFVFLVD